MELSVTFPRIDAMGTGREVVQLTSGDAFCYPLYYFIPSICANGRYLVYHRETTDTPHDIQLWRLDLQTGECLQLTKGECPNAHWQPWGVDPASGVLGDRAALSVKRDILVYIEGQDVSSVNVASNEHQRLFRLPEGRYPVSQNCISGDDWFVYVHVDRDRYTRLLAERQRDSSLFRKHATMCENSELCAFHLDTGEHRTLLRINYPIHHVHPYGNRHLVFSHVPGHTTGMGLTDIEGGWYSVPRTPDSKGGSIVHHVPTARGIAYELSGRSDGNWSGLCNPLRHEVYEFPILPATTHIGLDPEGLTFFYQTSDNRIEVLVEHDSKGDDRWERLLGPWQTYGTGQKSHMHPRLTDDRGWMQFVAGDPKTKTNHIFLMDVSDLQPTRGIPDV